MKLIPRIVLIILLLASWSVLYVEHNAKIKAQEALERFRADLIAAQADLAKQNEQGKARENELNKLREAAKEIYKLRSDTAQFKAQQQVVQQLRAENQQLRSGVATAAPVAIQPTGEGSSVAKENWMFAGYATPEATLQSVAWAMREGDHKAMLSAVTDDELKRMEDHWKDKTPEQFRADTQHEMSDVKGFRIMERNVISDDEVVLSVYTDGKGDVSKFSLKRIGNEWKFGGKAK